MIRVDTVLEHLQNRVALRAPTVRHGDRISLEWKPAATLVTLRRWEQRHPECLKVQEIATMKELGRRLVIPPIDKHSGELALI